MGLFGGMMGKRLGIVGPRTEDEEQQQVAALMPNLGQRQGFWQGGDKFTGRDGIAGILAVIGDALAQQGGSQGGAVDNLSGSRMSAIAMARKAQEQQAQQAALMEAARARGINPADVTLAQGGLGELLPKPEQPAPLVRDTRAFQNMTPEERASYAELEALRNPRYQVDAAGMPYQINSAQPPERLPPDFFDNGGPTRGASGGFPPRFRR